MISTVAPQDTQNWLQTSVQSFFSSCNWENQLQPRSTSPEVAILEQAVAPELVTELSFELKVKQFFAAINWDGTIAAPTPIETLVESVNEPVDSFTLTDLSDLF